MKLYRELPEEIKTAFAMVRMIAKFSCNLLKSNIHGARIWQYSSLQLYQYMAPIFARYITNVDVICSSNATPGHSYKQFFYDVQTV